MSSTAVTRSASVVLYAETKAVCARAGLAIETSGVIVRDRNALNPADPKRDRFSGSVVTRRVRARPPLTRLRASKRQAFGLSGRGSRTRGQPRSTVFVASTPGSPFTFQATMKDGVCACVIWVAIDTPRLRRPQLVELVPVRNIWKEVELVVANDHRFPIRCGIFGPGLLWTAHRERCTPIRSGDH